MKEQAEMDVDRDDDPAFDDTETAWNTNMSTEESKGSSRATKKRNTGISNAPYSDDNPRKPVAGEDQPRKSNSKSSHLSSLSPTQPG